jgi:hypothetical protein
MKKSYKNGMIMKISKKFLHISLWNILNTFLLIKKSFKLSTCVIGIIYVTKIQNPTNWDTVKENALVLQGNGDVHAFILSNS